MQNVSLVSLSASCAFKVKYSSILLVKKKEKENGTIIIVPIFYFPPVTDTERLLLNVHFVCELCLDFFFLFVVCLLLSLFDFLLFDINTK